MPSMKVTPKKDSVGGTRGAVFGTRGQSVIPHGRRRRVAIKPKTKPATIYQKADKPVVVVTDLGDEAQ